MFKFMLNQINQWFSPDFTVSKRLMGILCIIGGIGAAVGSFVYDAVLGDGTLGLTQKLVIIIAVGIAVIGMTLLPLNDRPA